VVLGTVGGEGRNVPVAAYPRARLLRRRVSMVKADPVSKKRPVFVGVPQLVQYPKVVSLVVGAELVVWLNTFEDAHGCGLKDRCELFERVSLVVLSALCQHREVGAFRRDAVVRLNEAARKMFEAGAEVVNTVANNRGCSTGREYPDIDGKVFGPRPNRRGDICEVFDGEGAHYPLGFVKVLFCPAELRQEVV